MSELENRCLRRILEFVDWSLYPDNTLPVKVVALRNLIDLLEDLLCEYCEVLDDEEKKINS